ncbi:MAG: YlbF family regulator [Bacilli bacterium]
MNEELYLKIDNLNSAIKNSHLYKCLIKSEKKMENSAEVRLLSKNKDEALNKYNSLITINGSSSKENESALKELHLAKKKLEEHKLVKRYLKHYSIYHMLLIEINIELFKDFKRDLCQNKKTK